MSQALRRPLPLKRGDLARGGLLFAYLFLILCAYVTGQVARDALFLGRFPAERLPYADICVFLLVAAAAGLYLRIGGRADLGRLSRGSLLAFGASGLLFAALARAAPADWLFPVVYVWVGVFGVVAPTQVWTLASYVLTPREARRLFGVVAAGATLGATVAGLLSSLLAKRYGAESLLLLMAGLALAAAALVGRIWRRQAPDRAATPPLSRPPPSASSLASGVQLVLRAPYLRAVAGVVVISSFVTSLCGWQFKAIAQRELGSEDALAGFFGSFNAGVGLACLLVQALLTAGVVRSLGLRSVLLLLPLGLALGSAGLLVFGSLAAAVVLKAIDRVLRYAIDRPAVELLYLPVAPEAKLPAKALIDTLGWRAGDALAGLSVLACVTLGGLGPVQLSWLALGLVAAWLLIASRAHDHYLARLEESVRQHRLDAEQEAALVLDRSTTRVIASRLDAVDPEQILYALELLGGGLQPASHPAVRGLLEHPSPRVRERALEILDAAGDRTALEQVEALVRDPALEVRTAALVYLGRHGDFDPLTRLQELGDFPDFSVRAAIVAVLARLGDERVEAAQLLFEAMVDEPGALGRRTRYEAARLAQRLPVTFEAALRRLLADEDRQVAAAAIEAARERGAEPFLEALLARLADPSLRDAAAAAIASIGEAAIAPLARRLGDTRAPLDLRYAVPGVLEQIGGGRAALVLADHLLEADAALRHRLLQALERLRDAQPGLALDRRSIELVLGAEIVGHYRSYQVLGALRDSGRPGRTVEEGLRTAMREELERIFRLLHLLEPGVDVRSAWAALESGDPVLRDQALDLLEGMLPPGLRALLLPLVDPEVSQAERRRLAEGRTGGDLATPVAAVRALAGTRDPWLRACAAYAIGALALHELAGQLDAWRDDPDPLLRETVRQALERLAHGGGRTDGPQG